MTLSVEESISDKVRENLGISLHVETQNTNSSENEFADKWTLLLCSYVCRFSGLFVSFVVIVTVMVKLLVNHVLYFYCCAKSVLNWAP